MKPDEKELGRIPKLRARLAKRGGSATATCKIAAGAGGPCYQWTRKERQNRFVALKEQYEQMREAIAAWREVQDALKAWSR